MSHLIFGHAPAAQGLEVDAALLKQEPRFPHRRATHLTRCLGDITAGDQPADQGPGRTGTPAAEHVRRIMYTKIDAAQTDDEGEENRNADRVKARRARRFGP